MKSSRCGAVSMMSSERCFAVRGRIAAGVAQASFELGSRGFQLSEKFGVEAGEAFVEIEILEGESERQGQSAAIPRSV